MGKSSEAAGPAAWWRRFDQMADDLASPPSPRPSQTSTDTTFSTPETSRSNEPQWEGLGAGAGSSPYLALLRAYRASDAWGDDTIFYVGHEKDFFGATQGRFRIYADDVPKSFARYRRLWGRWEMWEEGGWLWLGQVSDDGKGVLTLVARPRRAAS